MAANQASVKKIGSDSDFQTELIAANNRLVVVDFYADRCGPCKVIAPAFEKLCSKYKAAIFLKLNVDECRNSAHRYDVAAMPTFLFFKNRKKVHMVKGADVSVLEAAIIQHLDSASEEASVSSLSSTISIPGQINLSTLINMTECECLNNSDEHTLSHALSGGPHDNQYLESDCDEQLIICVSFSQPVKLHSLQMVAPLDGRAPKTVKVFINQPQTLDFDLAEHNKPVQELVLGEEDVGEESTISLMYVKYQNVQNITLFVRDNQSRSEETTVIHHLAFFGTPLDSTKMSEFKRVTGEKGERHS